MMTASALGPRIIQGGMGVAISGWQLARAVALTGQLGVVSGTALEVVCARRLQQGDLGGDVRRALAHFPVPGVADRILRTLLRGRRQGRHGAVPAGAAVQPAAVAGARRAHHRRQLRRGVPRQGGPRRPGRHQLPAQDRAADPVRLLRRDARRRRPRADGRRQPGRPARAAGRGWPATSRSSCRSGSRAPTSADGDHRRRGSTRRRVRQAGPPRPPRRPRFDAIVASVDLADGARRGPRDPAGRLRRGGLEAGGHNAPPRGPRRLDAAGPTRLRRTRRGRSPAMAGVGLPFWMAGSYGTPAGLARAVAAGAAGVQVGTAFAYCQESGMADE